MINSTRGPSCDSGPGRFSDRDLSFLCTLRGAPLSILVCMHLVDHPLRAVRLVPMSGYCRSTVYQGLRRLERLQLVTRLARRGPWQLNARASNQLVPPSRLEVRL